MASGIILTMTPMPLTKLLHDLGLALVYNTAVGLFLTAVTPYSLSTNLVYAQFVGFAIYATVRVSCRLLDLPRPGLVSAAIGIPLGGLVGFALATWVKGFTLAEVLETHPDVALITTATALIFGVLAVWHFHDEARMLEAQTEARAERLQRVEQEALASRTQLALLQAQIEPHFLFNTLSNVVGLIETQPTVARTMLLDLTALLRTSLARTRQPMVTLGEELDLLRAYLGIMTVRMGSRLDWQIDAAPDVLTARLPPLLVQPLVENAIRHGLEPKADAGRLSIRCQRRGDMLDIEVTDNGLGFGGDINDGTGLANVRQRLAATCGSESSLSLTAHPAGGIIARLRLPFHDHEPAPADR
jgi:signal transduction histidine kinase